MKDKTLDAHEELVSFDVEAIGKQGLKGFFPIFFCAACFMEIRLKEVELGFVS